jgi:hypothetical protein
LRGDGKRKQTRRRNRLAGNVAAMMGISLAEGGKYAAGGFFGDEDCQGDDYVLVGDQLVVVDPSARRVVALVPNVS